MSSIAEMFAHIQGLVRDDGDAFAEAIGHLEQGPRPLALASALEDSGRLSADRGNADDTADKLGRALKIYATPGGVLGRLPGPASPALPADKPSRALHTTCTQRLGRAHGLRAGASGPCSPGHDQSRGGRATIRLAAPRAGMSQQGAGGCPAWPWPRPSSRPWPSTRAPPATGSWPAATGRAGPRPRVL